MVASAVATIVWSSAERTIASISPRMMRLTVAWSRRAGGAEGAVTKELRTNENGARAAPRVQDENAVSAEKFKARGCRGGMREGPRRDCKIVASSRFKYRYRPARGIRRIGLAKKTVVDAVSTFGGSVKPKLSNIAISGAPEDQLRGPLDTLFRDLAEIAGLPTGSVHLVGETTQTHLKTRPDFAVTVSKALVGFIEVKAPGKGADPRKFGDPHDKGQRDKLKSLPNLLYTDGNAFSLWRDGKLGGSIIQLEGSVEK